MAIQTKNELSSVRHLLPAHSAVPSPTRDPIPVKPSSLHILAVPAVLMILALIALWADVPMARWFHAHCPSGIKKLFDLSEVFGHGLGVAMILLTVWVLAPQRRSKLPRLAASAYLAGLAAISFKLILARHRPNQTPLDSIHNAFGTFGSWLPWFSSGSAWESFPSGHTATAVGLALGLTWLLPRGKWLFTALVVLVALQRIAGGYHYLSDTLCAAAIGWLVATACMPGGLCSDRFERLEKKLSVD